MLFNFDIDDLIPLLAIGGILITAIYHTVLYGFTKLKFVGSYTLYLWAALSYLLLAITTVPEKTFKVPMLGYVISSGTFWLSLLLYLNFLLLVLDMAKEKETTIYKLIKKTYLFTPIYFVLRFPYFFFPTPFVATVKACGFMMDAYLFFIFGYVVYLIISNKKRDYNRYIVIGSVLLMFFNLFTSITYYTQSYLFGLSHVSFIALGYLSDILFFCLVVGLQIRANIREKYVAIAEIGKKELALAIERKRASDILLTHNFEVHNERANAIIQQRTLIGRRLHDDLSGSLAALKYLVQDFKNKAKSIPERNKFSDLEAEISNIYKEARNYSHELSMNAEVADSKMSYDIATYLNKLDEQFSKIGLLAIHTAINADEISNKLNITQTKHVYFLLKECITNTIKHTRAQHIWISIRFNKNECIIHFVDDGNGFDPKEQEGVGIMGMRERVDDLNGLLEIKTDQDGTTVTVSFNTRSEFM